MLPKAVNSLGVLFVGVGVHLPTELKIRIGVNHINIEIQTEENWEINKNLLNTRAFYVNNQIKYHHSDTASIPVFTKRNQDKTNFW
jgi:hypothetical protein